jgi:mannose/cellobiose epimerase-like protein (N-acyl-D-glucosamine 2-epimerase family)
MKLKDKDDGLAGFQLGLVGLFVLLTLRPSQVDAGTDSSYWTNAEAVHNCVVSNFLTSYKSYRIELNSTNAYQWYNTSQIYADSAMVLCGDKKYLPYMTNTYEWMNNLWDNKNSYGGYHDSTSISGVGVDSDKYVDDNALAGNVYLDCYAVTTGTIKTNFLNSAIATANWLMFSGQWDTNFGGGFWWDLRKQNKPTQSNGLAMQLFLRLYQITGQACYKKWANSVRTWLESQMFNSTDGLYVWQFTTNGTPAGVKSSVEFTYDNAIMIEADLLYYQVMGDSTYKTRAEKIATSLNNKLWNNAYGCYYFNTADGRVNPTWCGWASQSLIKLYQADGNTNWLNYAQRNIDYMNKHLRNNAIGGYYPFCNMDGSNVQTLMEGVDQAWMQKIQAMMSNYR